MTISNQTNRVSAVGTGAAQTVPFAFPITNNSDITVIQRVTATGVETTLGETTNYTVTNNGESGGSITTVTPFIANTAEVHIIRSTPQTQSLDLEQGGEFNAENIEDALDKNTKLSIENKDTASRSLQLPITDPDSLNAEIPDVATRAGKYLFFAESTGAITVADNVLNDTAVVSAFGETLIDDADAAAARNTLNIPILYIGDYATFTAAITAIGATVATLVISDAQAVGTDETVPSTLSLAFSRGGSLAVSSGKTVTINGGINAGNFQIFSGAGLISFGAGTMQEINPEWWGIDGTADEVQINQAAVAGGNGALIRLLPKTYTVAAEIKLLDFQTLIGTSKLTKIFLVASSGLATGIVTLSGDTNVTIKDLTIDGNYLNQSNGAWYGIEVASTSTYATIDNVEVLNCRRDATNDVACVRVKDSGFAKISNCRLDNSNNNLILFGASYCAVNNCSFEDNFLSEAVSFFGPAGQPSVYNTLTNCTFKDCRQAIFIQGATYTTVDNISIENCSDVSLAINNGMCSISNVQIKQGADAANFAVSIGQTQPGDISSDDPIILNNVSVDVNGEQFRGFHVAASNPDKVTLTNCHVFDTGSLAGGTASGFFIQAAKNITLIGCSANDLLGHGFELLSSGGVVNTNINLIGCSASGNGVDGINCADSSIERMQIIGGTYKNNSQTSAGTDYGIQINNTGNWNVFISETVEAFDDQAVPTQNVGGIAVGASTGNLITGATPPIKGIFNQGQTVYRKDATSGAAPGWVCVSRVDTQMRVGGVTTDTILEVDATAGMTAGDICVVVLDDGSFHFTDIASVTDGDTMVITDQLPSAAAINNNIYTYLFKARGNLA